MRSDHVFDEPDLLRAVLGEKVCMGFERGKVVFPGAALMGAKYDAGLI
jgi:hypothetical protein